MDRSNSRSSWSMVIAYAALVAATQVLWVTYTPVTTASADYWGVSEEAVGWLAQVFPLIYVVLALPFGYWADKWFRGSLAVGALLTAAGALLRLAPGYDYALAGQIVVGVAQPLVVNGINKIVSLYVAPARRPAAIAIGSSSLFIGILLSTVSVPFFMDWQGMPTVNGSQAIFAVATTTAFLLALKIRPLYAAETTVQVSIKEMWSQRWVRQLSLLLFVGFGLFIALTTWLEVLSDALGMTEEQVGIGLGLMTVAGIAGAGIVPSWAARGTRSRWMLCASLAMSVVTLLALWVGVNIGLFLGLLGLTGFLLLADLPIILVTAETRVMPEMAGTVTGLLLLSGNLGGVVLSLAVQGLLEQRGLAIGLLMVVALGMLPLALRYPVKPPEQRA
ncbi:MFS transporter [Cohnella yongneupensis]|uniref:MFS transporter n=1 Tax=Cohnella yongneupensis TaxID=425006 RepID=A0ABW0R372_9BACL